jgi:hypothetical protein
MSLSSWKYLVLGALVVSPKPVIAQEVTRAEVEAVDAQLEKILLTCLTDKTDARPFSAFIDEVIELIISKRNVVKHKLSLAGIDNPDHVIDEYIKKLGKIKFSISVTEIDKALSGNQKYSLLMPKSIKNINKLTALSLLNWRFKLRN